MALVIDNHHPFYLHHSDNPGQVLVTHLLAANSENYNSWKRAMIWALNSKNKIGFVDGSVIAPDEKDPQFQAWHRCNSIVASWILNSVCKELATSIVYSSTARNIWLDLEIRFQQQNGPRIFQLRRDFFGCTQGSSSVNAYYNKIKALWEELSQSVPGHNCNCGGVAPLLDHIDSEYVHAFLMGLNESYNALRGQILVMRPPPSITQAFALVLQEETQREVGNSPQPGNNQLACAVQGNNKNSTPRKDRPICSHCGLSGHTKEKCF